MRRSSWQWLFGATLVAVSLALYAVHYAAFRDLRHILLWSFTSICFLPISVLFVTLIIHRMLGDRERRAKLQKMNMVVGAFFSEVGTDLLRTFSRLDRRLEALRALLVVQRDWSKHDFATVRRQLQHHPYEVDIDRADLGALRSSLKARRDFLLRLLENPNLLEHEAFTSLLRAVFHLTEELEHRTEIVGLPDTDRAHLQGDTKRAYVLLVLEWLAYMEHLKSAFPYLFSLAMRTNPFDREASPIVIRSPGAS